MSVQAAETLLPQWLADEAAVRLRHEAGTPAAADPAAMAAMTGLELMQALAGRAPACAQHLAHAGLSAHRCRARQCHLPGHARARPPEPMGGVHGGWYATLLDSALGCSVHTALPAGKAYTTLN